MREEGTTQASGLTLQPLSLVALDHDAELQHQLRGALQKGLQQPQHVDIGILIHHGPVETPLVLLLPVALYAEVHGADVPVVRKKRRVRECRDVEESRPEVALN